MRGTPATELQALCVKRGENSFLLLQSVSGSVQHCQHLNPSALSPAGFPACLQFAVPYGNAALPRAWSRHTHAKQAEQQQGQQQRGREHVSQEPGTGKGGKVNNRSASSDAASDADGAKGSNGKGGKDGKAKKERGKKSEKGGGKEGQEDPELAEFLEVMGVGQKKVWSNDAREAAGQAGATAAGARAKNGGKKEGSGKVAGAEDGESEDEMYADVPTVKEEGSEEEESEDDEREGRGEEDEDNEGYMKKRVTSEWSDEEEELLEAFSHFGPVSSVHVVVDRETRVSKGFAYVQFEQGADAVRWVSASRQV